MRSTSLAVLAILLAAPASAHTACMTVTATGGFGPIVSDINGERTEYWIEEEMTFLYNGQKTRNVLFSGGSTPICSREECERYKDAIASTRRRHRGTT